MDPTLVFLHELIAQQGREPDHHLTARDIANALQIAPTDAEELLADLVALQLIEAIPSVRRVGDGPLDEVVRPTRRGRSVAATRPPAPVELPQTSGTVDETWTWRELPVLRAAVQLVDQDPGIGATLEQIWTATGLDVDDVYRAAKALESGGYVNLREYAGPVHASRITAVAAAARREVGQWPNEQTAADRMIAALEAIANNTDEDEDTRGRAKKILDSLRGAGREITISVATAILTGRIPGAQ